VDPEAEVVVVPLVEVEAAVVVAAVLLVWEEAVKELVAEVFSAAAIVELAAVAFLAVVARDPVDHLEGTVVVACLAAEYQPDQ
jgi:hypothetical protein